ncbi:TRAP transporter small permease [Algihabitans albus]|uniref:TRAP transporter small permease n=1 Tax=Algihabitans albus TaxID=2164067 RepID=UPI000E5D7DEB|nr:TRAP transporter small permease [Algihabitans albus]
MVDTFDRWFVAFNKALLVLLMAAMALLVFANVVARYLFGVSFGWAEEMSRFAMIWIAFLGGGLALRYGQLVAVETLQAALPDRPGLVLRWVSIALVIIFLVALIVLGLQFVAFSWSNRTPVLQISRGIPYLAVPLGAAFALLHLAIGFRQVMHGDWLALEEFDREAMPQRPQDPADAG